MEETEQRNGDATEIYRNPLQHFQIAHFQHFRGLQDFTGDLSAANNSLGRDV
jgi:hypothetical protein